MSTFIEAINESYLAYLLYGSRSTMKLIPMHSYLAQRLKSLGVAGYDVYYDDGDGNNEKSYDGIPKPDVGFWQDNKPKWACYADMWESNLSQNLGNLVDKILGHQKRCTNEKVNCSFFHFVRARTPYFLRHNNAFNKIEWNSATRLITRIAENVKVQKPTTSIVVVDCDDDIIEEQMGRGPGTSGVFNPRSNRTELNNGYVNALCHVTEIERDEFDEHFENGADVLVEWLLPELRQRVEKLYIINKLDEDDFPAHIIQQFDRMQWKNVISYTAEQLIKGVAPKEDDILQEAAK